MKGGATEQTHYCSRSIESAIWHSHAIYEALRARPDIRPDLVVGHSGYLSTSFLRELYSCPIVNYFEYYYRTTGSDMDFRPEFPYPEINRLRAHARNTILLLDLECCDLGYSPTQWQRDRLPWTYRPKVRVVFDGMDTGLWYPRANLPRRFGNWTVPDGAKLVTYVARGMESIRGFDIFMKAANILCRRRKDVVFVVVGEDRVFYGGDAEVTGKQSFKEWVLSQDKYDLSRFHFAGRVPSTLLAELFSITDLHVYLTVPFVLSWSLMNALACGATVLASDTAPVREMIQHGSTGLLTNFFDAEAMANRVEAVLDSPGDYRRLGRNAVTMIRDLYSMDVCLPRMLDLYQDATTAWSVRNTAEAQGAEGDAVKVLITIPHYYRPSLKSPDGRPHGSAGRDPSTRVEALKACLNSIRTVCAPTACVLSHADRSARILESQDPVQPDVIICTVGNDHLLDQIAQPNPFWKSITTNAQPPLLGYECHVVLRDHLGKYDLYCYLEDDIVLTDPWCFRKIRWFSRFFGEGRVLQPNRFESGEHARVHKIYVDGELPLACTAPYQNPTKQPALTADIFGAPVVFRGTSNPHAGCFMLSAAQMEHWARAAHFLDRANTFIGAMESAATLGILRSFTVYKPGLENADFLEVRHHGQDYLAMVAKT